MHQVLHQKSSSEKSSNDNINEINYPKITASKITTPLHLRIELNPVM